MITICRRACAILRSLIYAANMSGFSNFCVPYNKKKRDYFLTEFSNKLINSFSENQIRKIRFLRARPLEWVLSPISLAFNLSLMWSVAAITDILMENPTFL